jgi:hypothetical protein
MYVGKTKMALPARLRWHLDEPTNARMSSWFAELALEQRRVMRRPAIHMLEKVALEEWEDAERGWIAWCRQRGDLLNVDPGGAYRILGVPRKVMFGELQEPVAELAKRPKFPWPDIKRENAARVEREKAERRKAAS